MGYERDRRPEAAPSVTVTAVPGFTGDGSGLTNIPTTAMVGNVTFGHSALRVAHVQYSFAVDGGAVGVITPAHSGAAIPQNAIIYDIAINSTTAVTSGGSATISIGTSAGSSAASLLAATGYASFSLNGFVQGVPVPQTASTFVKLSAAGNVTLTVATAALTAGVIEIYVFYIASST